MSVRSEFNYYHCNKCGHDGKSRVSGAGAFILMIVMLCLSAWFLPLVVIALAFMVWMLTKPAKRYCTACKSTDLQGISDEKYHDSIAEKASTSDVALKKNQG